MFLIFHEHQILLRQAKWCLPKAYEDFYGRLYTLHAVKQINEKLAKTTVASVESIYNASRHIYTVQRPLTERISLHFSARWASSRATFHTSRKKKKERKENGDACHERERSLLPVLTLRSSHPRAILWSCSETNEHSPRRTSSASSRLTWKNLFGQGLSFVEVHRKQRAYFPGNQRKQCYEGLLLLANFFFSPPLIRGIKRSSLSRNVTRACD